MSSAYHAAVVKNQPKAKQDNLDESKNERVRLQEAPDLNRSLSVAYYLKDRASAHSAQFW
jgi:hypothetical protein